MSSVYVLEPPTHGKLILHCSFGDVEVELWPKEAPKAVRNFVQLAMEGYYDGTIFHRLVRNFILQGGDPTGTGQGGDSIYGHPFEDEFHQRLRFTHRGLLAMASETLTNDGQDELPSNRSQFFITLDKTEELDRQNTIFGKVVGDTIFNVLKCNDLEVDADERPLYPPSIRSITILHNPSEDIIPREHARRPQRALTTAELRIQERQQAKGVKNKTLLSFGGDEEEMDGSSLLLKKKKNAKKSAHDLVPNDPRLTSEMVPASETITTLVTSEPSTTPSPKESHPAKQAEKNISARTAVQLEIERLQKELQQKSSSTTATTHSATAAKPTSVEKKQSQLEQERAKFFQERKQNVLVGKRRAATGGKGGDDRTLQLLESFTQKLRQTSTIATSTKSVNQNEQESLCALHNIPNCGSCQRKGDESGEEEIGDLWMSHELRFEKDRTGKNLLDPNARRDNVDDLIVIDPRERKERAKEWELASKRKRTEDRPSVVFQPGYKRNK